MTGEQANTAANRRVILWLFGIPIVVFALSTALYYLVTHDMVHLGTVNHGKLVNPPLRLTDLPLKTLDGAPYAYDQPEAKWTFLVIGDAECAGDCERMLYVARQSIVALGKKMARVKLAYLTPEPTINPALRRHIDDEYRGLELVHAERADLERLFADAGPQPFQSRSFFVVDPEGWLMMVYQVADTQQDTLNTLGKAVVKDMKRLIK